MIVEAAALSHSVHSPSQTSQHATAAKCRLRRTAGGTRFDDLAASAEKLPGCAVHTLNQSPEAAAANFAISASLLAHRVPFEHVLSQTDMGVLDKSR